MTILLIVLALIILFVIIKNYNPKIDRLTLFDGTNGSGKSFYSIKKARSIYYKQVSKVKFYNFFHFKKKPLPRLYSNIPIKLSHGNYSYRLTWEHLLLRKRIEQGSVLLIDEVSIFLPQFDINNPNKETLVEFFTLFRHYFDGYILMNTQNFKKCHSIIRYCLSSVYNMSHFRTYPYKFPIFYIGNIRNLAVTEDSVNVVNKNSEDDTSVIWGFFPWRKFYDSRAFSERYKPLPKVSDTQHKSMKVNSTLICPKDKVKGLTDDKDI